MNKVNDELDTVDGRIVLCGANSYDQKYYYNPRFEKVPESVQKDLHIIAVLFTEEVGGIFTISFEDDGEIHLDAHPAEEDIMYDQVSAGLLLGEIRKNRAELFESLSTYYRALVLGEKIDL